MRLPDYDYSQPGAYFVTICTHERGCLFGNITDGEMRLNKLGEIVQVTWFNLPDHYPNVILDIFCIMPNHVHAIIVLHENVPAVGVGLKPTPTKFESDLHDNFSSHVKMKRHSLSEIVRAFKTFSARQMNKCRNSPGTPVWQRNYYEHIIRNEKEYERISRYIENNPLNWTLDEEYVGE